MTFRSLCLQPPVSPSTSLLHATPQLVESPASAGLGFALPQQARRNRPAESSSLSYGWIVHLLLLPTSPRGDAVVVGFRPESVCLERTFTSLILALSGALRTGQWPVRFAARHRSALLSKCFRLVTCDRSLTVIDLSPQKI